MKDRIKRYEIACNGSPEPTARGIEAIGGTLYEVHTTGRIVAGLSEVQKSDLEGRRDLISITLQD